MERRRVELNSAQLRCLANTTRARLLAELRLDGPSTSAGLAAVLGTNTGVTSYHLRQLAEVGLIVEDTGRGRGRERVWRAAHEVTSWTESAFDGDPDDRAARDWLLGYHARLLDEWRREWFGEREQWSVGWRDAATTSDFAMRLSVEETAQMVAELHAVMDRYASEVGPLTDPVGTTGGIDSESDDPATVFVLLDVFPSRRRSPGREK